MSPRIERAKKKGEKDIFAAKNLHKVKCVFIQIVRVVVYLKVKSFDVEVAPFELQK